MAKSKNFKKRNNPINQGSSQADVVGKVNPSNNSRLHLFQ